MFEIWLARLICLPLSEKKAWGSASLVRKGDSVIFSVRPLSRSLLPDSLMVSLAQYLSPQQGDIVSLDGQVLAKHQGLWRYTIGQGAKIRGMHERMFVASKDPLNNQIIVVPGT